MFRNSKLYQFFLAVKRDPTLFNLAMSALEEEVKAAHITLNELAVAALTNPSIKEQALNQLGKIELLEGYLLHLTHMKQTQD